MRKILTILLAVLLVNSCTALAEEMTEIKFQDIEWWTEKKDLPTLQIGSHIGLDVSDLSFYTINDIPDKLLEYKNAILLIGETYASDKTQVAGSDATIFYNFLESGTSELKNGLFRACYRFTVPEKWLDSHYDEMLHKLIYIYGQPAKQGTTDDEFSRKYSKWTDANGNMLEINTNKYSWEETGEVYIIYTAANFDDYILETCEYLTANNLKSGDMNGL